MQTIQDQIEYFRKIVPQEITTSRWEHSLKVAEIARELASIYTPDLSDLAYLAGIVHDITKQKSKEFHLALFNAAGDKEGPTLPEPAWHARSAPYYLKEKYGLQNETVFSAVRNHTLGGTDLSQLDYILYASDFLGSEFAERKPEYQEWRRQAKENLFFAVFNKAKNTLMDLLENQKEIHPKTFEIYNSALEKISN
ncbi:phosphohydrolase [Leptospira perolatii]|uniref:bis(5'-nucleosyl)-tetraphosphatase (symmetrical) n=1 Tax=Leptospira perolatii TaxID=2023191 RepID=A0A2M9ZNY1_9LEPT|nr:bis(5'-nucleosyl)-tetraphosphatase (symmetrical) YqeK [Leptospira perolatii]PJZ69694.1 phosphohydrolase [Leptospira perolatii]PJZ73701.1 phosphohydrolase [Leptospira perolatii]